MRTQFRDQTKSNAAPSQNLEWAKNITEKLTQCGLDTDWEVIRRHSKRQWRKISGEAVEKINKTFFFENCVTVTTEGTKINTKTKRIHH